MRASKDPLIAAVGLVLHGPDAPDDAAEFYLREADRIHAYLHKHGYGDSRHMAVFVTPEGVLSAHLSSAQKYRRLQLRYGNYEIGVYDRNVDKADLRLDVLHAAREIGALPDLP